MNPTTHPTRSRSAPLHLRLGILALGTLACLLLGVPACQQKPGSTQPSGDRVSVFVSIPPQRYFVQRIGGRRVDVAVLVPPGQSHHTYEPTPKQVVSISNARVFFRIGVPFEKNVVAKIGEAVKNLRVVDTSEGIAFRNMDAECAEEHHAPATAPDAHDAEHEGDHHEHGELDPHTWLDPRLVKHQAAIICRELIALDPAHAAEYQANLDAFHIDLDNTDARIRKALKPLVGREFFVFHPGFGYFADAYGLKQVAVETGGKQPSAKHLEELIARAKRTGVRLIFVQPQFTRQSAEAVAQAIGGAVVVMDPLAEKYLDNLVDISRKIEMALAGVSAGSSQ
ncbi:MAG TPA: zinc ABC transporter substrate-binding protein [Phycisphaerae bacterium]|nr:zinc ABC transporter substrate-binding protein [Phycisphaerae bacterium]HRY69104.1 zinc ABC transporter substrate-binding protein [Phycisphaerae bacterium]HSA29450.1 zinc ABC transporter substrate-binding protein [Phycisphaerae bacterium]